MSNFKEVNFGKKSVRRSYSKIRTDVELPGLIDIQTKSFDQFVEQGLREIFDDVSPVVSFNGNLELSFQDYHFEDAKYSVVESKLRGINYARPLKVNVLLHNTETDNLVEHELFMGDIPYMTPEGTFVINGAERVIVSQIVRSAGAYYSSEVDKKSGETRFSGQIIPTRGAWLEYEAGSHDVWYAKIDRSKKIPLTTVLKAYGLGTNKQITDLFGTNEHLEATFAKEGAIENSQEALADIYEKLRGEEATDEGAKDFLASKLFDGTKYDLQEVGRYKYNIKLDVLSRAKNEVLSRDVVANEDVFDDETGEILFEQGTVVAKAGEVVKGEVYDRLAKARGAFRYNIDLGNTLCDDPYNEILYINAQSGNGEVKEVKIIGNDSRETSLHITMSDILASVSYFMNLYEGIGKTDDIDHLGNRRLRLVGELIKNQFRSGMFKLRKNIIDRMSTVEVDKATPQNLINIKPLTASLREFFGSSQLSQFMDQINPLAEIAQKRRISALGAGGITRDRAGAEVRDVHNSHYGRMCPIETPEGASVGLITSLATYAKVDKYGFIQTPYFVVTKDENGENVVSEDIVYLTANDEAGNIIAAANSKLDSTSHFIEEQIVARDGDSGETVVVSKHDDIHYMDISPKQIVSVAAACVPFLEHDDATRALMGANMQRQAVPIINPDSPIVGTGMEYRAAKDSGSALIALQSGTVIYADAKKIVIKEDNGQIHKYELHQFLKSNASTAIMQRPIVKPGEHVDAGDVIADGQSMKNGELALGRNVRIAFMTWEGYNFEDAVILSEKMVYNDEYTSLHIEDFKIESRDTKLGAEDITREIPNVKDSATAHLDAYGVVIPGTEVEEGDILVGKVTPKGQTEPSPEERLLFSIFNEKSRDVKDSSLRVQHGGGGIVQSVQYLVKPNRKARGTDSAIPPYAKESDDLAPGVNAVVRVYIIQKRKIQVGDKMAGRHGNKGVISNILPVEDMPFTADGQPIDIMLNPQGVPSRMNIGQVLELHLGMAAKKLGIKVATPVFDGATIEDIEAAMAESGMPADGRETLYDGRTGEPFEGKVNVGIMYFIKLNHMVDDKLHARNVGKYTLVTQQPMGGKAQNGGQRFGEMEVWALQAYGAAHTLREIITVKSDDLVARDHTFDAIVGGKPIPEPSIPESFRVLTRELQSLGLHVELINNDGENELNRSIVSYKIKNVENIRVKHSLTTNPEKEIADMANEPVITFDEDSNTIVENGGADNE